MKRRGFLGFFGGVAVAGPKLLAQIGDPVLRQAGFPTGGEVASAAPVAFEPPSTGVAAQAIKWIRRRGIPAWKMNEIRANANHERHYGLDPDIAALVSVSPGWKAREQRRRNIDRLVERSLAAIGKQTERRAFMEKIRGRFGFDNDWYE